MPPTGRPTRFCFLPRSQIDMKTSLTALAGKARIWHPSELTDSEAALLAAILPNPERHSVGASLPYVSEVKKDRGQSR